MTKPEQQQQKDHETKERETKPPILVIGFPQIEIFAFKSLKLFTTTCNVRIQITQAHHRNCNLRFRITQTLHQKMQSKKKGQIYAFKSLKLFTPRIACSSAHCFSGTAQVPCSNLLWRSQAFEKGRRTECMPESA
jgi:hypothetical protein